MTINNIKVIICSVELMTAPKERWLRPSLEVRGQIVLSPGDKNSDNVRGCGEEFGH